MDLDLLEEIVMELEIMQVDELAAIAPRDVLRLFQFLGLGCLAATAPPFPPTKTVLFSVILDISPAYRTQGSICSTNEYSIPA